MSDNFDVAIIGSGPGGYVAAIRAAQLGLSVAIIERENLGGICLNWGCIPTKALLRSAEVYHNIQQAESFGLKVDGARADIDAVVKRSRKVAGQLNSGVRGLMKKNKITVVEGEATLAGPGLVDVALKDGKKRTLQAKNIVIATGARARELPNLQADGERVWTYRHALVPKQVPERLLVIGSGAIGVEFASFYADMGSKVTIVEVADRIMPLEDADISAFMDKALRNRGMELHTACVVKSLNVSKTGVTAQIEPKGKPVFSADFSHAILAVGIVANTENLGLEALGVRLDRGHIVTDGHGRTGVDGIWAIGDVTGPPWLAHKASHEGVIVAESIAGLGAHPLNTRNIPACVYARPQVASVGMNEAAARDAGHEVRVGHFPFIGNGKAIALGESEGFIKTIFDSVTGELLGAHMVGAEVTELIQGYVVARGLETTEAELIETVFAHPTLSEAMHESVLDAYGRVMHY